MDPAEIGRSGLVGWRKQIADRTADPLAQRTPLSADQARALIGGLFFALSVYYVVGTIARAVRQARG